MSSSLPLVSIVVPVFNGARYLRESLDSILGQTYQNTEVLVMDDASTDETPAIIASYGDRVRAVRQPHNTGMFGNVNAGIQMARGEFVAVYHSDDVYLPTIVQREVEALLRYPAVGAVFASDMFVDPNGREYDRLSLPPEVRGNQPLDYPLVFNALLRYKNTFLRCPGAMVRAAAYRAVGTYRQDVYGEFADLDMWLRIARRFSIVVLEEHLFRYRHFHGSAHHRYHHVRTEPGPAFLILADYLAEDGARLAAPDALAAFEAHRAADTLMRSISCYIRAELREARQLLAQVPARRLLQSGRVQRTRLLALWAGMHVLLRLPRSGAVAEFFTRRWHSRRPPLLDVS